MNAHLKNKLKALQERYSVDGFIILGVFGSVARGTDSSGSDIDILFETTEQFKNKYQGLAYFGKVYDIKEEMKSVLNREVDIADKNTLNEIGKRFILGRVVYV